MHPDNDDVKQAQHGLERSEADEKPFEPFPIAEDANKQDGDGDSGEDGDDVGEGCRQERPFLGGDDLVKRHVGDGLAQARDAAYGQEDLVDYLEEGGGEHDPVVRSNHDLLGLAQVEPQADGGHDQDR